MRAAPKSSSNPARLDCKNRPDFSSANMVALATIFAQVVAKATIFSDDFHLDENIVEIDGAISEIVENPYS